MQPMAALPVLNFNQDDSVNAYPLPIGMDTFFDLEDNLLLFFTGFARSASTILMDQDKRSKEMDEEMLNNMHYVKELGLRSKEFLDGRTHFRIRSVDA